LGQRDEVTGEWRKLHNEELNILYSLTNIVRVIKSRRMRWAGHVARMGREEAYTRSWWGEVREIDNLKVLDVDGRITLRGIFKKDGLSCCGSGWVRRRALVNAVKNLRVP
jgi:hypothetical protein